jgi:hypothetical protein
VLLDQPPVTAGLRARRACGSVHRHTTLLVHDGQLVMEHAREGIVEDEVREARMSTASMGWST